MERNVLLSKYTTFRIGGRAKYFFKARNKKELISAIKFAKSKRLPFFVLGGGSNLLVSDKGFRGVVIKIQITNYKFQTNSKSQITGISVGAGLSLSKLVQLAAEKGLSGLEWAVGIPGTVGGAVYGNAGAFKKSMKDITKTVTVLEGGFKIKKYKNKDCRFGYRDSVFKHNKNLIIISTELKLKKGEKKEIQKKIKENLEYKKRVQPLNYASAGSIFKNPHNFSAGELIEKCGLKGKKIGGAKISEKHANFIVNLKKAKAKDVKNLINLIKKEVKKKFKINLEEEIRFL
jgi:UDP-N-acetylmuramate dehydrogenase